MSSRKTASPHAAVSQAQNGEMYIANKAAIEEIVTNVMGGNYCIILGPHYCEKSQLLRDIKARLDSLRQQTCLLLDLEELRALADAEVLSSFALMITESLRQPPGTRLAAALAEVSDEKSLAIFFQELLRGSKRELVLLVDHLERIRMGPLHSLLRTLRAIYNQREVRDLPRLGVVAASSLSLADMALGPTSPFNIARIILVEDLSPDDSETLARCRLQQRHVEIDDEGLHRLLWAANGDRYLLCQLCNELDPSKSALTKPEVTLVIDRLVEEKAGQWQPLTQTVHALEDDTQSLLNLLKILKSPLPVPRRALNLDLDQLVDKLQLTGAVSVKQAGGERFYEVRNEIYLRHLTRHFTHDRVVHVLGTHGEWEEAISYLEELMTGDTSYRSMLLGTILDSIYAARNDVEAYHALAHRLCGAFPIKRVCIYIANAERTRLALMSHVGFDQEPEKYFSLEEDSPEVRAYSSHHYETATNAADEPVFLVRILRDQWQPLGLITIHNYIPNPQSDDFQALLAFLKQVGRALGNVIQLTSLYDTGKQITSSLDLDKIMQSTVDEAIRAVPNAQRGALFLWNEKEQKLLIGAQRGYREGVKNEIKLAKGQGYVGMVYKTGEPVRIANVLNDPRTLLKDDPDIQRAKSVICVPLKAWDQIIGVLCLDNMIAYDTFQKSNLWLLSAFADQAAIAIKNAQLYSELSQLWGRINQGNLNFEEIFLEVVQSITRVTSARAANMLLLNHTDYPELSVSQKPELSVSAGLTKEYDNQIRPRPEGLTYHVLRHGRPLAVEGPDAWIGVPPLARERGIQAYLGVPMKVQDRIIGVLFVHHDKPHVFSSNEVEILSLFASLTALAITNKRLLDQVKHQFSYLAHATITPLAAIGLLVETLYKHSSQERVDQVYRVIKTNLADLNTNLKNNLALARPETHMLQPDFQQINLSRLVSDTVDLFLPEAADKGISLVIECKDEENQIWADRGMVTQVLHNLVKNALFAFADRHQGKKIIQMSIEKRPDELAIVVADNGIGIPVEKQAEIFQPFYSGSMRTGIGLTISRQIAQQHSGGLFVKSEAGKGSKFYFVLPNKEQRQ
ncbi:MAG TPA: GAF domain-containing sensor histidine kinase [Blastocatellia bacterium]|nr:GAF domain-containing sensor histidine kinase [Blastocatellia bacterium]